jgi:hypothetical protein
MNKVLGGLPVDVTGFDPQALNDLYSNYVNRVISSRCLPTTTWPAYKLVPNTAKRRCQRRREEVHHQDPEGHLLTPDPVFQGKRREPTAADHIYCGAAARPQGALAHLGIFENKLVGGDEVVEAAKKSGSRLRCTAPGLQALDRYTLQVRRLPLYDDHYFAHSATGAVAREVVEKHADGSNWAINNPVGTGPYMLRDWKKGSKVVIEANPGYRDRRFPEGREPADKALEAQMKGKKLPAIGRIEISIIEESNPRFLAFQSKQLDLVYIPTDFVNRVIDNGRLEAGVRQGRHPMDPRGRNRVDVHGAEHEDPVIGGYSKDKTAAARSAWATTSPRKSASCARARGLRRRNRFRRICRDTTPASSGPIRMIPRRRGFDHDGLSRRPAHVDARGAGRIGEAPLPERA